MNMQYAGFFRRLLAFFIDNLPFVIPNLFIKTESMTQFLIYNVLWTAYYVWMNGKYGATVGKMVMKIKITKVDGSKITYVDALLRELGIYLSFIVLCIGFLNILWDSKKQGWHDKIAGTVVVKVVKVGTMPVESPGANTTTINTNSTV